MGYYVLNATLSDRAGREDKVRILDVRTDWIRCIDTAGKRCQHRVVDRYSANKDAPWPGIIGVAVDELEVVKPKKLRIKSTKAHSGTYVMVLIHSILKELESDILEVRKTEPSSRINEQELEACNVLIYLDVEPMKLIGPRPTYRPLHKLNGVSCYNDDIFVLSTEVVIGTSGMGSQTSHLRSSTVENFIREITIIDYSMANTTSSTKFSRSLSDQTDAVELLKSSVGITEPGITRIPTKPFVRNNLGLLTGRDIDDWDERQGCLEQPRPMPRQAIQSQTRKPYQRREKEFFFKELLGASDG